MLVGGSCVSRARVCVGRASAGLRGAYLNTASVWQGACLCTELWQGAYVWRKA